MSQTVSSVLSRRRLLAAGGTVVAGVAAGCLDGGADTGDAAEQQLPVPVAGDPDAAVTVMAFEDFRCPHCRRYNLNELPGVWSEYVEPGVVRYEHRDFPVVNETSWTAANAARAVQKLGTTDDFWRYATLLFRHQSSLGPDTYERLATEVGVDGQRVRTAAANRTYGPTIRYDRQAGRDLGVRGTPTVLVNDAPVTDAEGNPTYRADAIAAAIERARSESG